MSPLSPLNILSLAAWYRASLSANVEPPFERSVEDPEAEVDGDVEAGDRLRMRTGAWKAAGGSAERPAVDDEVWEGEMTRFGIGACALLRALKRLS